MEGDRSSLQIDSTFRGEVYIYICIWDIKSSPYFNVLVLQCTIHFLTIMQSILCYNIIYVGKFDSWLQQHQSQKTKELQKLVETLQKKVQTKEIHVEQLQVGNTEIHVHMKVQP